MIGKGKNGKEEGMSDDKEGGKESKGVRRSGRGGIRYREEALIHSGEKIVMSEEWKITEREGDWSR